MAPTLISGPELITDNDAEYGGPDYNLGKNHSVTFTWKLEDGEFATAFTVYYVNARSAESGDMLEHDELEECEDVQFYVQDLTETWTHDTEDPFTGSGIDTSLSLYGEGSAMFYRTLGEAEGAALSMAKMEQDYFYFPENF